MAPLAAAGKSDKHHRALAYFSVEMGAQEFVCWCAIQQYKSKQSKRRAIFIFDTWVKDAGQLVGLGSSMDLSIFDKVNMGSQEAGVRPDKALGGIIANMKAVKTWTGKLSNGGQRAAYGATPANLFDGLEKTVGSNMHEYLKIRAFDTERDVLMNAHYQKSITAGRETLKTATFECDPAGVW